MQTVAVILSVLTIFGLVLQMLWDHLRHKVDLLSTRNVFYLGLINFQFFPIAVSLGVDTYMRKLTPSNPAAAGMTFIALSWLFLIIFNIGYKRGWIAEAVARRVHSKFPVPSPNVLLMLGFVFLAFGAFNRFIVMTTPLINTLGAIFSIGFLCTAAGCAMWAWLPRMWNPVYAIPAIFLTLSSMLVAMHLSFGRRDLLSVVLACVWAAYWGYLRERGNFAIFSRLGGIGAVGVILLALLSATRGEGGQIRGITQILSDIRSAQVSSGIQHMATVQDSGPITLYLIDTRPDDIPYDTLHTLKYFITQPIPRAIWPEKPMALGMEIVTQAGVRGLARGFSYGPGIIGHIANDNPYLALPIYALFFAVALSFLDRLCRYQLFNPFVMIPVGAGLGELMAIPRGEVGLFVFRCVFMFLTAWLGMWAVAKALMAMGIQLQSAGAADEEWTEAEEEYPEQLAETPQAGEPEGFPSLAGYHPRSASDGAGGGA
ncbi:MAG: hypothetical protein GIKADHBN_01278 [Phycisphaerales bacterium]|nr:hypothetical protein [Phycisphaerales bacterium]